MRTLVSIPVDRSRKSKRIRLYHHHHCPGIFQQSGKCRNCMLRFLLKLSCCYLVDKREKKAVGCNNTGIRQSSGEVITKMDHLHCICSLLLKISYYHEAEKITTTKIRVEKEKAMRKWWGRSWKGKIFIHLTWFTHFYFGNLIRAPISAHHFRQHPFGTRRSLHITFALV